MNPDTPVVSTIGHSTRPLDDFIALLKNHRVEHLVDVRSFPGSKRYPQFNKENLANSLASAGIRYTHMVSLGGRRKKQEVPEPDTYWRNKGFANYADYTKTAPFQDGLHELEALARTQHVAVMCAEALWWRCHRRFIADALEKDGFAIHHIMGPERAKAEEPQAELPGL